MRALLAATLLLALASTAPLAAADPLICVGDGPLGFCVNDPDELIDIDPPIYCLQGGEIQPCPEDP